MDEFAKSAFDYKSFNDFFCRALKPSARPIAPGEKVAVFPADGRHLAFPDVALAGGFYVKGAIFTPPDLLGAAGEKFAGGAMLISRLCPTDYHRFHFPVGGLVGPTTETPGWLYSVSPLALRRNLRYLLENKRQTTLIETPEFGTVAMVEIGATNVGSILQNGTTGRMVKKGDEKGLFSFGGSCVVTFFQRGRIAFDADIVAQSEGCIETYARMGDRFGRGAVRSRSARTLFTTKFWRRAAEVFGLEHGQSHSPFAGADSASFWRRGLDDPGGLCGFASGHRVLLLPARDRPPKNIFWAAGGPRHGWLAYPSLPP